MGKSCLFSPPFIFWSGSSLKHEAVEGEGSSQWDGIRAKEAAASGLVGGGLSAGGFRSPRVVCSQGSLGMVSYSLV